MSIFQTVAGRLALAMGGAGLALVGIVVALAFMLVRSGQELERFGADEVTRLTALAQLEATVAAQAVIFRDLGLNDDVQVQERLMTELKSLDKTVENALARLEESDAPDAATQVSAIRSLLGTVAPVRKQILAAIEEARYDDLKPLLLTTYRPAQQKVGAGLRQASQDLVAATSASVARRNEARQRTLWVLAAAVASVLALSALGCGWVILNLTRTLGGEPDAAARTAELLAQGRLDAQFAVREGDRTSLIAALAAMQKNLVRLVSEVRKGADEVVTASEQIAQGTTDLSVRTEQQSASLQETASSMEQVGAAVRQNAENAKAASDLAAEAASVAGRGGAAVSQVVATMQGINESSSRISDIIGVIDGIAFQTNILALNAAVEAARAGDHGRGFAVVAGEVRSLAQRSAEAAREIRGLITTSMERVAAGSAQVERAGTTMQEVVATFDRVNGLVKAITHATAEQSRGIEQVGLAVQSMDRSTQQNAAMVEESAAAAEGLKINARKLSTAVAAFQIDTTC